MAILRTWAKSLLGSRGLVRLAIVASFIFGSSVFATQTKENQVKAVFLYHFTQFVEWPSSAFSESNSSLVIGVLGEDPFGSFLDETVRGERINGHPLVVRRFKQVEDSVGCHILFVPRTEKGRLDKILGALRGRNILTVSDIDDFSRRGGMIRFGIQDGKTKLYVNPEAAKAVNLTISSKLLRSAQIVTAGGG